MSNKILNYFYAKIDNLRDKTKYYLKKTVKYHFFSIFAHVYYNRHLLFHNIMIMLRDKSWDFVKFFLMFFVVFGHICPAGEKWTPVTRIIGLFVIPGFFLVSGFFQSKIVDFRSLVKKFRKTIFRIVIPLIVWGGIYVFLSVLKLYKIPDISCSDSVQEYVENMVSFLKYTPFYIAGFYWFITALLLCITFGSCMSFLITIRRSVGLFILGVSPLFFCILPYTLIELYHFSFVWLFYVAGMLFKELKDSLLDIEKNKYGNVICFVMLLVAICYGVNFYPEETFYYTSNLFTETQMIFIVKRYALYLTTVLVMLYWIRFFYNRFSKNKLITRFANYGQDTLFIYCSHMLFLDFLYKPFLLPVLYHVNGSLMMIICEHVVGLLISVMLYVILQYLCGICHKSKMASFFLLGLSQ